MKLQDVFDLHRGERPPHLQDWRLKGPRYCYAVPRGPAYSSDGKHWELCNVPPERIQPR